MSKFLFLSDTGDGLGLALRLKDNGHNVAAWIRDKRAKRNYDGLLFKPRVWEDEFLDKDTIVVFDSSGGGRTGDRLRGRGHHVFMGSVFADSLEMDRDVAFTFMEQVGIKVPEYVAFTDWNEGKAFIKREKGRWVFKPSADLAHASNGISSYVGKDEEDLIDMLTYYQGLATQAADFELQRWVEGVSISTEGWFNGEEFMVPFNHTVERKQCMNDDLGASGGCSGNLVWAWPVGTNHIIEEGVKLMAPVLREFDYIGPIDLNTIVNHDGVWALEFTPRFGYDALPAFLELYQGDIGDDLIAPLARKEHPKEMVLKAGYGSALRVNVPPYPAEQFKHDGFVPVRGFEKVDRPHLYFYDIMLNEQNKLVTTPYSYGAVVTITSHGFDPERAFDYCVDKASCVRIPDKMYRTDLHKVLDTDIGRFNMLLTLRSKVNA